MDAPPSFDNPTHATPNALAAFLAGRLSPEQAAAVAAHLSVCASCAAALDSLPSDRLDELLKATTDHTRPVFPESARPPVTPTGPDGYELLTELGRGGMGVVYQARQTALRRTVALKLLPDGRHAAPESRTRFRQEALAAARLRHPNIVQVYDVGGDSIPYLAMEYVPGPSLATHLRANPMSARDAAQMVTTLARAIDYAHTEGVLHRDLKPGNVLLEGDGTPKIADFGLARCLDEKGLTMTGDILGTPGYMAPEQISAPTTVGPAADVYGLGAILYQCLTGRPPFVADTPLLALQATLAEDPVRPGRLRQGLPADLETICMTCLQKDPHRRYASAGALADDLQLFLAGRSICARPTGPFERLAKWCRRRPAAATGAIVVVLASLVGLPVVSGLWWAESAARAEASRASRQAEIERDRAEAALYVGHIARARLEWSAGHFTETTRVLEDCQPSRRGWEWHFLHGLGKDTLLDVSAHTTGWSHGVVWSPDGRWLVSVGGGNPYAPTQGPATVRPGEVTIWSAANGQLARTLHGHTDVVLAAAFRADGNELATAGRDGTIRLWNPHDGSAVRTLVGSTSPIHTLAYSGQRLLSADDGSARVWDLTAEQAPRVIGSGAVRGAAWSPDGRWIALVEHLPNGRGRVRRLDITMWVWDSTMWVAETLEAGNATGPLAFSPDSRLLAVAVGSGIEVWDRSATRPLVLGGHTSDLTALAFSPDGQTLASAAIDATARIWHLAEGKEVLQLAGHPTRLTGLAFDPDGARLATVAADARLRVWDLTRRREAGRPGPRRDLGAPEGLAFAADSRGLIIAHRGGRVATIDSETNAIRDERQIALSNAWLCPGSIVALDEGGRWLAGVDAEEPHTVCLWDWPAGTLRKTLPRLPVPVWHVALSANGQWVAAGGTAPDAVIEVRVWDQAGTEVFTRTLPAGKLQRLALGGQNRLAVSGTAADGQSFLTVWDLPSGREVWHVNAGPFHALTFAADGRLAYAGPAEAGVHVRNLDTGQVVAAKVGAAQVWDAAFSPDGRRLALAGQHLVQLLNADSLAVLLPLRGLAHASAGTNAFNPRVRFSPDGRRLAAVCHDVTDTVAVWSADPPDGHPDNAERRAVLLHLTEAAANESVRPWHLQRLRADRLATPSEWTAKANLLLHSARWAEARAAYQRSFTEQSPRDPLVWFEYAALLLDGGDGAGYEKWCRRMAVEFAAQPEAHIWVARASALAPTGSADPSALENQVQQSLPQSARGWWYHAAGTAAYRAGHYSEAADWFRRSLTKDPSWGGGFLNRLWLAMTCQQLGQLLEASEFLRRADIDYESSGANRWQSGALPLHPHDWLEWRIIRAEARTLFTMP